MSAIVKVHCMPRTVYAAQDGVLPEWRFLLVVINRSEEERVLTAVTTTLSEAGEPVRRARSGDTIENIVQGSPEVEPGGAVVLEIRDEGFAPARSVGVEMVFRGTRGTEMRTRQLVPLRARKTAYLAFPVGGEWLVAKGRSDRHCIGGQFGFDFMADEDRPLHEETGATAELADYAAFGRPVCVPAAGEVVACTDDQPDMPPTPGGTSFPDGPPGGDRGRYVGNYLVIRLSDATHLYLSHLMEDSLTVSPGDRVREGQMVARVGNSGNTSGPHLHVELLDGAPHPSQVLTLQVAQSGLPIGFRGVVCRRADGRTVSGRVVPQKMDVLVREKFV